MIKHIRKGVFEYNGITVRYNYQTQQWYIQTKQSIPVNLANEIYQIIELLSNRNRKKQLQRLVELELKESNLVRILITKRIKDYKATDEQILNIENELAKVIKERVLIQNVFLDKKFYDIQ